MPGLALTRAASGRPHAGDGIATRPLPRPACRGPGMSRAKQRAGTPARRWTSSTTVSWPAGDPLVRGQSAVGMPGAEVWAIARGSTHAGPQVCQGESGRSDQQDPQRRESSAAAAVPARRWPARERNRMVPRAPLVRRIGRRTVANSRNAQRVNGGRECKWCGDAGDDCGSRGRGGAGVGAVPDGGRPRHDEPERLQPTPSCSWGRTSARRARPRATS
jgi:hypothetical protein